ncbi:MAG: hypothetical protein OXC12_11300 [Spirochaetaceae bacterium]|nr:hypothetical protein [Spirochaetaceae bacterium]
MDSTTLAQVRDFVQEALAEGHPRGGVSFGPIEVRRTYDADDGSPYLRIVIVVDGSTDDLDVGWLGGMPRRLLSRLSDVGIEDYPNLSYVSREEWSSGVKKWLTTYPQGNGESC